LLGWAISSEEPTVYRHILVPVDDSRLSIETASRAVAFAKTTGARITFFHARPDFGATDAGALVRVMAPEEFADQALGNARAVLAKAEADARASNVAYESVAKTTDRPYEGIIDTARERDCNLIFMASHGRRGFKKLVLGSQTQEVLAHATISVLVCSVETNDPSPELTAAINIIKAEHRSMAAVIEGLKHTLRRAHETGETANTQLLRAIVRYFHAFPESLHHPKEEEYVFAKLQARAPGTAMLLTDLQSQHRQEPGLIDAVERAMDLYQQSPSAEHLELLAQATDRYAEFMWRHMSTEEKGVIPECQEHFTSEDWQEIARAFDKNGDPRFDKEREAGFEKMFSRIMNLAEHAG
jgi:nucleotide-binding universal stress UspA family protein/hemerythrin-like domain-containing protein